MYNAYLLHLSNNMWEDRTDERLPEWIRGRMYQPYLRFDDAVWEALLPRMAAAGINLLVWDVGDGVKFIGRPEIGLEDAWSVDRLRRELRRCRELGIEVVPKLNFSTVHDTWLGRYSRMVSTPEYYACCQDLIAECCDIFDGPELFHLGLDEERFEHVTYYQYRKVRGFDLWSEDLQFYFETVRRSGSRPWMWSDMIWHLSDEQYLRAVPGDVMQSNWDYGVGIGTARANDTERMVAEAFRRLDALGYDQIPCGSNIGAPDNMNVLKACCAGRIAPARLKGYLMAPWRATLEHCREALLQGADLMRE